MTTICQKKKDWYYLKKFYNYSKYHYFEKRWARLSKWYDRARFTVWISRCKKDSLLWFRVHLQMQKKIVHSGFWQDSVHLQIHRVKIQDSLQDSRFKIQDSRFKIHSRFTRFKIHVHLQIQFVFLLVGTLEYNF